MVFAPPHQFHKCLKEIRRASRVMIYQMDELSQFSAQWLMHGFSLSNTEYLCSFINRSTWECMYCTVLNGVRYVRQAGNAGWLPLQAAAASQTKPGTPHMLGGLDGCHPCHPGHGHEHPHRHHELANDDLKVLTVPPSALLSFPILAIHLIQSHTSSNLIQGRQRHSSSTPTCLSCRPRLPDKASSHLPPSGSQRIPVRHDSSNA
jgi:hypothetical protein